MTPNDLKWLQMTSLNLLGIQRLIWSPFRSFRAIKVKRRQNYLYYKHAKLLKIALSFFGTQSEIVRLLPSQNIWTLNKNALSGIISPHGVAQAYFAFEISTENKRKMQLNLRKQIIKKWETKEERTKNYKNGSTLLLSLVFATAT